MKIFKKAAIMNTILMEMSKMRKVTDRHTDDGRTMVNRSRHRLTWNNAPGELTNEDLQDGCCGSHHGYGNKMVLAILNLHVVPIYPTKFRLNLTYKSRTYASTDISFVQAHGHGGRSLLTK